MEPVSWGIMCPSGVQFSSMDVVAYTDEIRNETVCGRRRIQRGARVYAWRQIYKRK
jgi:hypothetical protein